MCSCDGCIVSYLEIARFKSSLSVRQRSVSFPVVLRFDTLPCIIVTESHKDVASLGTLVTVYSSAARANK